MSERDVLTSITQWANGTHKIHSLRFMLILNQYEILVYRLFKKNLIAHYNNKVKYIFTMFLAVFLQMLWQNVTQITHCAPDGWCNSKGCQIIPLWTMKQPIHTGPHHPTQRQQAATTSTRTMKIYWLSLYQYCMIYLFIFTCNRYWIAEV